MTREAFIEAIAAAAQRLAPKYGIAVVSPIVAQACLESAYGTSSKAQHHNYFGLKYRPNRVKCNSGFFQEGGSEQRADGSYIPIKTDWYAFDSLEKGVEGYFQFINIPNYANLKGVTDPLQYLKNIKADHYATSLKYVENVYNVIIKNNLTKYDSISNTKEEVEKGKCPLVDCVDLSPNHSGHRTHSVDRITPHCVVGQLSAESIGRCFESRARGASCNYGIGYDGRVCLVVDEDNRSWCSSNRENDQRAITIEVASDKTHPYAFKQAAYDKLVALCVDICKRYNKKKLLWIEDKRVALNYNPRPDEMILTVHRWFARKACPGDWMFSRMGSLALEVTKRLGGSYSPEPEISSFPYLVQIRAKALNIRKGPGVSYQITGCIRDMGKYTIVDEKSGWGKLKSGAGWISLKYTTKI